MPHHSRVLLLMKLLPVAQIAPPRHFSRSTQPMIRTQNMVNVQFTLKGGTKVGLVGTDGEYQICRGKDHVKRDGETVTHWYGHQYCLSLRTALILILEMKVRAADARTLKELQA